MQTLQTARLTTKPRLIARQPPPRRFEPYRPPPVRAPGILRQRVVRKAPKPPKAEPAPRSTELLTRFFANQGIPLACAGQSAMQNFLNFLNPEITIPEEKDLEKYIMKQGQKPLINFQKTVGPLSVTIDVVRSGEDDMFLAFSIHYFEEFIERKSVVYSRKLLVSEIDADSLLNTIRRSISPANHFNIKFSNIVCPNEEIYSMLASTTVSQRVHTCFYNYMTQFVTDILDIGEFAGGLGVLREFTNRIRSNADLYSKFRRMQLAKNGEFDIPTEDDGSFCDTLEFLTRCLILHDSFAEYSIRVVFASTSSNRYYITDETFNHLVYLQRLLSQCAVYCREMSTETSSISQILPAVNGLKSHLTKISKGYRFENDVEILMDCTFGAVFEEPRFKIATFLDLRYTYRDGVYCFKTWNDIEELVVEEFVSSQDVPTNGRQKLEKLIRQEIKLYRSKSFLEHMNRKGNPFDWWKFRHTLFPILSFMAREYLACPAVTVDAARFFSNSGKFEHVSSVYPVEKLQGYLNQTRQEFRGRGCSESKITEAMVQNLEFIVKKIKEKTDFQKWQEFHIRNPTAPYPLIPVKLLPRTVVIPIIVPPPPPGARPIKVNGIEFSKVVSRTEEVKEEEESAEEENIKLEPVDSDFDLDKVKVEPMEEQEVADQPKPVQVIRPHNFTQKFAGKQKFIPKFPVKILYPPPISIRAPIPKNVGAPRIVIVPKALVPSAHMLPIKIAPMAKKMTPEPLENVKLEPNEKDLEELLEKSGTVFREKLTEKSAEMAMQRHRLNLEKRPPCNRRCAVCRQLEHHKNLKNVTIESEKLLIMVSCIYRGELSVSQAEEFMNRDVKTYICHSHFGETLDKMYELLGVNCPDDVLVAPSTAIENLMITVLNLKSWTSVATLRSMICDFCERNQHLKKITEARRPPSHHDFLHFTKHVPNDVNDNMIIPKEHRQPRKQVLETDAHEPVVKVIEQDHVQLPTSQPTEFGPDLPNSVLCCFCSKRGERSSMLKMPHGSDRLAHWIEKFGPEFEQRLGAEGEHRICRIHFKDEAFSRRGRLLKGMIPDVVGEKVVVTYRIRGDEFLKVKIRKSGKSDKCAQVDLANCETKEEEWLDDLSDEMPDLEPYTRNHKPKKRGRPRKIVDPNMVPKSAPKSNTVTSDPVESDPVNLATCLTQLEEAWLEEEELSEVECLEEASEADPDFDPRKEDRRHYKRHSKRVNGKFVKATE